MAAVRKLAAILAADVVGYSRMMGEDEAGTAKAVLERQEAAAPIVAGHGGRVFKTMGDALFVEFPSIVSAAECALAIQRMMAERNADLPESRRVVYRIGVHLGDVLIEGDDLLGDGVNIAARLEGVAEPGGVCLSGAAYEHVRERVEADFVDLGETNLKNIARPTRIYGMRSARRIAGQGRGAKPRRTAPPVHCRPAFRQHRRRAGAGLFRRRRHGVADNRSLAHLGRFRHRAQHGLLLQGQAGRPAGARPRARRPLRACWQRSA